ncbi:protocadherin gamma-B1-like [Phyllobates terribilis]|uniref:protocadherin gamma-B1-like n=1 Tax=Phyllobates terribilis TaxID=111132 RepID=UPI003CCB2561
MQIIFKNNSWLPSYFIRTLEFSDFVISNHASEIQMLHAFQEKNVKDHKVVVIVVVNGHPSLSPSDRMCSQVLNDSLEFPRPAKETLVEGFSSLIHITALGDTCFFIMLSLPFILLLIADGQEGCELQYLVSGQIHYSIKEEMRKDSVIANIADDLGLDIKQLSSRKLRIVSRTSEKYFYIKLDNGNLYIRDRIDRETLCGAEASCYLMFDAMVADPLNIFQVTVDIQDINDNSPQFYHKTITLEIIELTSPGARFALESAEDLDIGSNSVQTYKLSDNQYFTLTEDIRTDGTIFPELVLEKPLDRETQDIHEIMLTALDGGNPIRSGTTLLKIIVIDANDNAPVFSQDMYKVTLKENIAINSTVIILNATDNDEGINAQIAYIFRKSSGHIHDTGTFSINTTTGEIKTHSNFDFEVIKNYELSVQAKDGGGLVAHCKVLVEVIDVNDNAPEISITSLSSPIPEDSAPGTMIALIEVHDQDSGDNADVDCQILEDVPFILLSLNNYYKIALKTGIDREKSSFYNITIIATDRGSPSLSSTRVLTLDISDINDNPPMFSKSIYVSYVAENNLPGASIFSIQASDPDTGDNAKIIYSISSTITETPSMTSYLSINIETGVLYAQRSFDYEQNKEFIIEVTASDNRSPSLSSNVTLCIHIVDQNDNAPKILYPSPDTDGSAVFEMVPFVSEPGSLITKVVAVDADSGHNSWLSYHFIPVSDQNNFVISEHTGEIRTSRIFQEKDKLNYKIIVMVKDNGHPTLSATTTLSLIIADDFQQVVPKFNSKPKDEETQINLQFYLVVGLALISLLFIITVMVTIISKCKQPKPLPAFSSLTTNLYPPIDPRTFSMYSDGSLPLPYSYNMCVALDPTEGDFTYMNPSGNVPVENLIDADNTEQATENLRVDFSTNNQYIICQSNMLNLTERSEVEIFLYKWAHYCLWIGLISTRGINDTCVRDILPLCILHGPKVPGNGILSECVCAVFGFAAYPFSGHKWFDGVGTL